MIRVAIAAIALSLGAISAAQGQTKSDEQALHGLPQAFAAAFNKHDGHQLAQIMADDIDFVTVGAMWLHGKPDFEKYHTRLLNGRFHGIRFEVLQVAVRFLRPDIGIVHWSWTASGDRNPDGTARERRYGMMTMVAEKRGGSWLVVASQNDNAIPWDPAEGQMPRLAMPIPGPDQRR
ncbi:MAG TPA: SgcJ/EcaC family oxidoreductase [Steroidobacteraceae bacterium]|nr:SgcJ/EcaC family oxidoreductase [Steroidobacteraceae bacterium]